MLTKEQFLSLPRKFLSHISAADYHTIVEFVDVNGRAVKIYSDVKILKSGSFGKPRTFYSFAGKRYRQLDKLIEAINKKQQ